MGDNWGMKNAARRRALRLEFGGVARKIVTVLDRVEGRAVAKSHVRAYANLYEARRPGAIVYEVRGFDVEDAKALAIERRLADERAAR